MTATARRLAAIGVLLPVAACATHPPTPPPVAPAPALLIAETLDDDAELCVVLDPYHAARTVVCLTVGDIRRMIRGRALARRTVEPDGR